jgi:monofunctional glycosyltransferase
MPRRHPAAATPAKQALRWVALVVMAAVSLQAYFALRVVGMALFNPTSTAMQRSEAWRLAWREGQAPWAQGWVNSERMSAHLKRAVIASEDSGFVDHTGFEWDAIERAYERHVRSGPVAGAGPLAKAAAGAGAGGSTLSQQLAKNLFLSGERNLLRKGQEFLITQMVESVLGKSRILEIYLNHVEWGEGLFGAQMAARYYHRVDAAKLNPAQAAKLAVMLPAPKRFEQRPGSAYLNERAAQIEARMRSVNLP